MSVSAYAADASPVVVAWAIRPGEVMKKPGRHSLDDTPATLWVGLRVTPGQLHDLQQVAAKNHTDIAGVLRDAVNTYVADFRDLAPVFRLTKP
jgi:hypothetical protein